MAKKQTEKNSVHAPAKATKPAKDAKSSKAPKTAKAPKIDKNAKAPVAPAKTVKTAKNTTNNEKKAKSQKNVNTAVKASAKNQGGKIAGNVRVMMLGGLNEIGKNLAVIEFEDDMIIIDCGLAFPDEDMLGVDLVIPDFTYLEKNVHKIRGILVTHGHEDHIGAIPYLLKLINVPVYATRLTLGILESKLAEHRLLGERTLVTVEAGTILKLGVLQCEFIRANHSIADACMIAIRTPEGVILHTGDFKLDVSPVSGEMMDLTRIGEYGREGVLLLMCESTNVGQSGFTPSERRVGASLDHIFMTNPDRRIVIATFSSNVHRVQQIINSSVKFGRKVAITGRSMVNVVGAAVRLGYMEVPDNVLIDIADIHRYPQEMITIITTGSQGEPMSALYRMAFADHSQVELTPKDLVVLSSHAIPGNEKLVSRIINELYKKGVGVYHDEAVVHVSGHACREELKLIHALTKPRYFMPIHGEYHHLMQHKELAEYMGMDPKDIFVMDIGQVLELNRKSCKRNGTVPAGRMLVDGYGVGDVGSVVLRDRRHLAQDGLIVVVATVDVQERTILSGPDLISRGFVYVRESEELMDNVRELVKGVLCDTLESGSIEWTQMKTNVKDALSKYLYSKTKRKPMILPVIMNV